MHGKVSNVKSRRGRRVHFWTWAHRLTAVVFFMLLVVSWRSGETVLRGSATATRLADQVPFVDPLATLEVMLASRQVTVTLLIGMAITVLLAVFLGRVFCGWLCPLGLILELYGALQSRLRGQLTRHHIMLPQATIGTEWKYAGLITTLILSAVFALPVFTMISPVNWTVLGIYATSRSALIGLGVLLVIESVAPRVFCRSLCPLGALYALLGAGALFRVHVRPGGTRLACRQCSMHCPMGIDVMEDHVLAGHAAVRDLECVRCGVCADVCQGNVVRLGFRSSHAPHPHDSRRDNLVTLPECHHDEHADRGT